MRKFTLFVFLSWVVNSTTVHAFDFSANLLFSAKLTGAEETPPVVTSAVGVASFALNATHDTLCIEVTVQNLSGPITDAHVHFGARGVAGPPIIPLGSNVNGNRISAVITGLADSTITGFLAGRYYINVHTAANPGGEIRGQIGLETEILLTASLDGNQSVPPVTTNGYGLAIFRLYQNLEEVIIDAKFIGLSDSITGISLYSGAAGLTGPEIAVLDSDVTASGLSTELDPDTFLSSLLSGNVYIGVKTAANPSGEIRGQVIMDSTLAFDILLDASQEIPPTASAATGVGYAKFSPSRDTLWYDIVFDSLSVMPPTLAHFHEGPIGVAGPPVINLTSSIAGNRISGMATGVADSIFNLALRGQLYANIHSTTYPAGEIRGQLRRYAREGFTYVIDGNQETPPLVVPARGSGLVSIDYLISTLHFMIAVDSLSGIPTAAHFHNGLPGVPGPPVFTLTPFLGLTGTDDTLFGWWTDEDTIPLTPAWADSFLVNHMYFNIHTALNPSGEARGNVQLGGTCFQTIITGLRQVTPDVNISLLYPNPSSGRVWLNYSCTSDLEGTLHLLGVAGNTIWSKPVALHPGDNTLDFNMQELSNGIYFITLTTDKGNFTIGKVLKY